MGRFLRFSRMNRRRLLKLLIFSAALLFEVGFGINTAKAQQELLEYPTWVRIGAISPPSTTLNAIYFSDTLHGVVAYDFVASDSEMWYTLNARRFFLSSVPPGLAKVRRIRPIAGKLYGAVAGQDLIVSTNQGVTWKYSGLGLTDAYDVYADPAGKIRTLTGNMRQFARVDQMHCVAAGLKNAAVISGDGGVTWNTLFIGNDTVGYSVYGDTCKHVFLYHNSEGSILRSSDNGVTWQNPLIGCGDFPETIVGSDEVVYVSTSQGFYRTTDDGYTYWSAITSVSYGPPVFSVCGPMGNAVVTFGFPENNGATLNYYYICITKDGGDYALRSPIALADELGNIVDTFGITSVCPGLRIPIPFLSGVDSFATTMVVTQDSLSEFKLEGSSTLHFKKNVPDTAWFDYNPRSTPENSTLTIDFHHTWNCSNWDESRTVIVTTPAFATISMPDVISGGCSAVDANGTINYSAQCQPLIITSVSSSLSYLKSTTNFPDTILSSNSQPYQLPFQFDAGSSNIVGTDTVEIKGQYLGTNTLFDTILTVQLNGTATVPEISSLNEVNFRPLSTCIASHDTSVFYYNRGCVTDTVVSVEMSDSSFVWLTNTLPIILRTGDSVALRYRFLPSDTTQSFGGITTVYVVSNGDTIFASMDLSGITVPDPGLPDITSPVVQCGYVNPCTGNKIFSDTIINPTCDTILISEIALFSDSNYFSLVAPINDTLVLGPGDSGIVKFQFAPKYRGQWSGALNLKASSTANFESNDIGIEVNGFGAAGGKLLSANVGSIDVGSFYACQQGETRDTTITLFNTGCDTLTVNYAEYTSTAYSSATHFPFSIAPGSSHVFKLHYSVDSDLVHGLNGTITFYSDADTGGGAPPLETITFTGSFIQPAKLHLSLSSPDSGKDGQLVTFYLILSGGSSGSNIPGLNFYLTHNDDLLSFVNYNGVSIKKGQVINSIETDTVKGGSSSGLSDTIGSLTFRVYLTDSSATPITLSKISFDSAKGIPSDCIGSLDESGSSFTYIYQCGGRLIQESMSNLPFIITSITPNPASSSILVGYRVLGLGYSDLKFELQNVLGETVLSQHSALSTQHSTEGTQGLDISSLPSGIYFVRLSQNGFVQTKQVVIER